MKILLINGSPRENGAAKRAILEMRGEILKSGCEAIIYEIGNSPRYACISCGFCRDGEGCVFGDIDELVKLCENANALIICTPTHYASAPGSLTSILSRLLFSYKKSVAHKPVGIASVGRRGGLCEAIADVRKFFEFASCPIVSGIYPPILYAKDFATAELDEEGLENMRSLSRNVIYVARCVEAAGEKGILPPEEKREFKTDISSLKSAL